MFTDDFFRATDNKYKQVKSILMTYEKASGQAVHYGNLSIFYIANVDEDARRSLSAILGVQSALNTSRYLGLPSLVGRKKKDNIFIYLTDRL